MMKQRVFFSLAVAVLPLTAFAYTGAASSTFKMVTALPEASTLGLLGTSLIAFAIMLRRRLKLTQLPQLAPIRVQR